MTKLSGSCRARTCLRSTSCPVTPIGKVPSLDGARQELLSRSIPLQLLDATRQCPLQRRGRSVRSGRAAAEGLQSDQLLAEAGLHSRIISGWVRHRDVRWLQTVPANAIRGTQTSNFDHNIMRLGRWIACLAGPGSWKVCDPGVRQKMYKGKGRFGTCGREGP